MRIRVETSSGMPITRQIAAQIRAQCASGVLKPGNRLPSVRALAAELAVNQNTILRVYERLTAEGLLERRHGEGTFVSDHVPTGQMKAQRRRLRQEIARLAELAQTLGVAPKEVQRLLEEAFDQINEHSRPGCNPAYKLARTPTMNQPAIELRGIVKSYGKKEVLTGLDLSVPKGSVLGLLGTNGAGKTTMIKCALGLIRPQAGEARLLGEPSWTLSAEAKMRIGYVPQVINLYPWMKVRHLLDYTSAFYTNWNHDLSARLTEQWSMPLDDRVRTLSVGQLQRLSIMLALAHEPELLVLDEPAASLDPLARRQFLQMIIDLAAPDERTVLFSTHITSDLEHVADRVAVLKSGRIAWHGLLEDLKEQTRVSLEDSFLEMHNGR